MSFYRLHRLPTSIQRLNNVRPPKSLPLFRLQSSSNSASKRSGTRYILYGVTLTSGAIAGTVAYANYDQEFKLKVDSYVPGFGTFTERSAILWNKGVGLVGEGWQVVKDIILPEKSGKIGLQMTYENDEDTKYNTNTLELSDDEHKVQPEEMHHDKQLDVDHSHTPKESVPESVPSPTEELVTEESKITQEPETITEPKSESSPPMSTPPTSEGLPESSSVESTTEEAKVQSSEEDTSESTKDTAVIEKELQTVFQEYAQASDQVIESLKYLGQALTSHYLQVLEATKTPESEKDMEVIAGCIAGTEEAVENARKQLERAKNKHHELSLQLADAVSAAVKGGVNELAEQVCEKVSDYMRAFDQANEEVIEAETKRINWQHYKEKIEESKASLTEELGGALPDMSSEQEALVFLLKRKIELLQAKITEMTEEEKQKIAEVLKKQEEELQQLMEERVRGSLEEREIQFQQELEKMEKDIITKYEEKLKEKLLTQSEAHSHHLKDALQRQAEELTTQLVEEHDKKMAELDDTHQLTIASALAHLKGIQSMIDTVAKAGESTRIQQSVRAASDTLINALLTANADPSPYSKHKITNEVSSLTEVAQDDKFITTILSAIPEEVLAEGFSSEAGLKTRFEQVKRVCYRVALVPEEGGGLGTYLLSFIQSLLTIDMVHPKMADLSVTSPKSMSTFALLRQAKTYLDHGDLETAVRLVNQLQGESRRVAQDWIREAILYLETRQAVMAISEYLAACSVSVLQ